MKTRKHTSTYSTNEKVLNQCDLSYGISLLMGRWKIQIIFELENGPLRFSEIKRGFAGATEKMLIDQLRALEHDGLVSRNIYAEVPVRVTYCLTEQGRSLLPVLDNLSAWAHRHRKLFLSKE